MPDQTTINETTFFAFDLEATGIAPGFDQIVELAAARFEVRGYGDSLRIVPGPVFTSLVRAKRSMPPPIARLTGIDDTMIAEAPSLEEVWPQFLDTFQVPGTVIAMAHSAKSDLALLVAEAARCDLSWGLPPFICTFEMARRVFSDAPSLKLSSLVTWRNCVDDKAGFHRARADALHTRNLFGQLASTTGARTLRELGVKQFCKVPEAGDLAVTIPDKLQVLAQAIEPAQRLSLSYRGGSKGRERRPMTPLGFYKLENKLFLRAWCHVDDEAKSFRCDRIIEIHGREH